MGGAGLDHRVTGLGRMGRLSQRRVGRVSQDNPSESSSKTFGFKVTSSDSSSLMQRKTGDAESLRDRAKGSWNPLSSQDEAYRGSEQANSGDTLSGSVVAPPSATPVQGCPLKISYRPEEILKKTQARSKEEHKSRVKFWFKRRKGDKRKLPGLKRVD
uniref:Uncharacterized protein n=1 Tax=Nelumbo nucifera TaxID=4432 RepID=A0A822ZLY8_NELNU|nr:TPA_asm: hypothetical protein HUJ06_002226 [Nelumbo nucifera]